jgi:hypothetical protein
VENPDIGIQNNDYDMPEGGSVNLEEQVTRNQRQKKSCRKDYPQFKSRN